MATKKQKRAAALAKREEFLKKVKEEGLLAQQSDKAYQDKLVEELKEHAEEINIRHREILSRHGINEADDYFDRARRFAQAFQIGRVDD